jgi:type III secretion protein Q
MVSGKRAKAGAQGIRERLPACPPEHARVLRQLFAVPRGPIVAGENGMTLRLTPAPHARPGELIECTADDETFLIGLSRDDIVESGDDLAWSDYVGEARLLAWTLAHERLLSAFAAVFGRAVIPAKIGKSIQIFDGALWLGFEASLAGASSAGGVALPPILAANLVDTYAAAAPAASRAPRVDWTELPCSLIVAATAPMLDATTVASLRPGDVVVLGTRDHVMNSLQLRSAGEPRWIAAWNDDHLHILARHDGRDSRSEPMNEHESSEPHVEPAESVSEHTPHIPVRLDFEIGEVTTNLRELDRIEPGYIFELPSRLEGSNVAIRANGRHVGNGELVAVGETLGVRLTEWRTDGF